MQRRHFLQLPAAAALAGSKLRAGFGASNINPHLGAPLAGNFTTEPAVNIHDDLFAKALTLDNGNTRFAIVQLDLCVVQESVCAAVRKEVQSDLLICCTHTHSAPAAYHAFQSVPEPVYLEFLSRRIVDAVRMSERRLAPARMGWGFGEERTLAFNRRYLMKDGTVRMNPGIRNPDVVKPVGPTDPSVGVLAVQSAAGDPIAVLGNFSLHYVGGVPAGDVSADYFARWCAEMGVPSMLLNGAQGDINNIDVLGGSRERVAPYVKMNEVARTLATESKRVLGQIRFSDDARLGSSTEWLEIPVRRPSAEEVARARALLADVKPQYREREQVYAREAILVAETFPKTERVPVQAVRIGGLLLAGMPGEPFVELGLEVRKKVRGDLFVLGLCNGHVGYVPTERAHEEGGYETWLAKTSYLAKDAAPKVVAATLRRLESLSG